MYVGQLHKMHLIIKCVEFFFSFHRTAKAHAHLRIFYSQDEMQGKFFFDFAILQGNPGKMHFLK